MFQCYSYTIIRERIDLCLLKLQLLKYTVKQLRIGISSDMFQCYSCTIIIREPINLCLLYII